jgi:hypothetical protein
MICNFCVHASNVINVGILYTTTFIYSESVTNLHIIIVYRDLL